ncbi:MAG: ATPase P [Dethiobacteria bacterium]
MSLKLVIPGRKRRSIILIKLVLDLNGTLTVDGIINANTIFLLKKVAVFLEVHIITADTLGLAVKIQRPLNLKVHVIRGKHTSAAKAYYIQKLGQREIIAIGNGVNDTAMLGKAAIGIAVLGPEVALPKPCAALIYRLIILMMRYLWLPNRGG